ISSPSCPRRAPEKSGEANCAGWNSNTRRDRDQNMKKLASPIRLATAALLLSALPCLAQWDNHRAAGIPRTPDGKPDLNAAAPKTPDGKTDISGLWQGPSPPGYLLNIAKDLKPGELVMLPWAQNVYNQRRATEGKDDPHGYCIPSGVPRSYNPPYPFKIV